MRRGVRTDPDPQPRSDKTVDRGLVPEHEKSAVQPDVQASAASYQLPWSLVGSILAVELAWLCMLGYFLYRLLT